DTDFDFCHVINQLKLVGKYVFVLKILCTFALRIVVAKTTQNASACYNDCKSNDFFRIEGKQNAKSVKNQCN
ncbi:MAG: hypothetical protein IKR25_08245, partial [Muribaculaceae bacterium]|nr:hypothetical protein [Muribaculaceae bacterium]